MPKWPAWALLTVMGLSVYPAVTLAADAERRVQAVAAAPVQAAAIATADAAPVLSDLQGRFGQ